MSMTAFFWTGFSWCLAAIVLPKVAWWGYVTAYPESVPGFQPGWGPRPPAWRDWLTGIWLIASGSVVAGLFLLIPYGAFATEPEPFGVLVSRYSAMVLVTMGLYTSEFLKGRYDYEDKLRGR